jgi:phosphopantetheine--protein transferase-like protein
VISLPLDKFKNLLNCPELTIHTHETWGSNNPDHRSLIRNFIVENLSDNPKIHNSISHCRELGLVAVASKNIGIDIEEIARVKEAVIKRMSTEKEIQSAPDFACLWAAKEASFKALMNYKQPMVVSRLEIGNWQKMYSQIETFKLLNNQEFVAPIGQGLVFKEDTHVVSIFVFPA